MVINKEIALQDFIDREEAADNALDEEQAAEGIMKLRRGWRLGKFGRVVELWYG